MFAIIVGCSQVGFHLAKVLRTSGQEVALIDRSSQRCQFIKDQLGQVAWHGDGCDPETLRQAGIGRADTLVAATGRDETNLVICQLARRRFKVPRVMSLVGDSKNETIFSTLGVDVVVDALDLVMSSFETQMPGRPIVHLLNLRPPETSLVSITLPADGWAVGRKLSEVELPPHSFVTLVVKRASAEAPRDDLVLEADDQILAVTVEEEEQTLYDVLTGAA